MSDRETPTPEATPAPPVTVRAFDSSAEIGQLAAALAAAQGEMASAIKDSVNPHFKSRYADLASTWDACRGPLSKHGIAVVQIPGNRQGGVNVTTTIAHKSGEWMSCTIGAETSAKPQHVGSAITYLRRYGLAAMVGIAPDDDDGEAAQGRSDSRGSSGGKNGRGGAKSKSGGKRAQSAAKAQRPFEAVVASINECQTRNEMKADALVEEIRAHERRAELEAVYKQRWADLDPVAKAAGEAA